MPSFQRQGVRPSHQKNPQPHAGGAGAPIPLVFNVQQLARIMHLNAWTTESEEL